MAPLALQPDSPILRRSPTARMMICALAAVIAFAGIFQHSPRVDLAVAVADVDASHETWDAHTLSVFLAKATDRHSERGTDPTCGNAFAVGWMPVEQGEVHAHLMGTLDVTHDVAECARRGLRTSGRHPPL